jgi:hypothetical protein
MNTSRFIIALAAAAAPAFALAQTPAPAAQNANAPQDAPITVAQAGQWVSPESPAATGTTRADVYRDLLHAQRDGQLATLNATLYAHH